ncbi:hypothetical protein LTR28_002028, partial [Elasticomyces elasticus]
GKASLDRHPEAAFDARIPTTLTPKPTPPIRARADAPRLLRMPIQIQHAQTCSDSMALQHLERNNRRVLHSITDDLTVEDLHASVITAVGEQRHGTTVGMELHRANGLTVVAERLVRGEGEVEVMPEEAAV